MEDMVSLCNTKWSSETMTPQEMIIKEKIQELQHKVFEVESLLEYGTDQRKHLYTIRVDLQNYINWWIK